MQYELYVHGVSNPPFGFVKVCEVHVTVSRTYLIRTTSTWRVAYLLANPRPMAVFQRIPTVHGWQIPARSPAIHSLVVADNEVKELEYEGLLNYVPQTAVHIFPPRNAGHPVSNLSFQPCDHHRKGTHVEVYLSLSAVAVEYGEYGRPDDVL